MQTESKHLVDHLEDDDQSLEELVEMGVVNPTDMLELLQVDGYFKGIIDMRTGKNVEIATAAGKGLITKTAVLQVLGTDAQIKGIVDVSTGDTLSVGVATRHGIIDRQTGMRILERQVASGGLLKPPSLQPQMYAQNNIKGLNGNEEEKLQILDAVKIGIIDPVLGNKLMRTERARGFNLVQDVSSNRSAAKSDDTEPTEVDVKRAIRDQLCALGGILDPHSKEILPLHVAISRGLLCEQLSSELMQKQAPITKTCVSEQQTIPKFTTSLDSITEEVISTSSSDSDEPAKPIKFDVNVARNRARMRHEMRDSRYRYRIMSTIYEDDEEDSIEPETGQLMTLGALSRKAAVDINSGSRLLEGLDPTGRIVIHHTGDNASDRSEEKEINMHIIDAFNQGLLNEMVTFRLLEAHLAQGGIPDLKSHRRLTPEEAWQRGYISEDMAKKLIIALKNLLKEQAQMYVFRVNEYIAWCMSIMSDIQQCDFLENADRKYALVKLHDDAIPEMQAISDVLEELEMFLERDRERLDAYTINELIVLSTDLQDKIQEIERALRDDHKVFITARRSMIGELDPVSTSETSTETSDGVKRLRIEHLLEAWSSLCSCYIDSRSRVPLTCPTTVISIF